MGGDTCIKSGSYCPVCRGVILSDCWHDAREFHAGSAYLDRVIELKRALEAFTSVRDQYPQSAKLINKKLDGLTPITVTVTKAQFLAAVNAVGHA